MRLLRLLTLGYLACTLLACATTPKSGGLPALKPVAETFHQRIRWRDYRGAGNLVVPERRGDFEAARKQLQDDRDLSISDFTIEDARLSVDGYRAWVVSKVSWVRLPSATEHTDTITSEWVFRDGRWLLARQDAGPFVDELGAPYDLSDAGR